MDFEHSWSVESRIIYSILPVLCILRNHDLQAIVRATPRKNDRLVTVHLDRAISLLIAELLNYSPGWGTSTVRTAITPPPGEPTPPGTRWLAVGRGQAA